MDRTPEKIEKDLKRYFTKVEYEDKIPTLEEMISFLELSQEDYYLLKEDSEYEKVLRVAEEKIQAQLSSLLVNSKRANPNLQFYLERRFDWKRDKEPEKGVNVNLDIGRLFDLSMELKGKEEDTIETTSIPLEEAEINEN